MKCARCPADAVEGYKTCPACLAYMRTIGERGRRKVAQPATDTHRTCSGCGHEKLHAAFSRTRTRDGRWRAISQCKECRRVKLNAWRHSTGTLPFKPREERDGKLRCNLCTEWFPRDGFHTRGKGIADPWCKDCKNANHRQRRALGTLCECGEVKEPGQDACPSCLDIDGVTDLEGVTISALRVLGGEAQMAAIVEDIGGDINEDAQTGAGYRRAYRGMSALRKRGAAETRLEKAEASRRGADVAVHRLKGGR